MNYLIYYRHCSTIIYSRFCFFFIATPLSTNWEWALQRATRYMLLGFRFLENIGILLPLLHNIDCCYCFNINFHYSNFAIRDVERTPFCHTSAVLSYTLVLIAQVALGGPVITFWFHDFIQRLGVITQSYQRPSKHLFQKIIYSILNHCVRICIFRLGGCQFNSPLRTSCDR